MMNNYRVVLGYLRKVSGPNEVLQDRLQSIRENPYLISEYLGSGQLSPEYPGVREVVLKDLLDRPYHIGQAVERGYIKPDGADFRQFLLRVIENSGLYAKNFSNAGWISLEDSDVKGAILKNLQKYPDSVNSFLTEGIITQKDANHALSKLFGTPVEDFSHSHSSNLASLQKLRSLAKKNGGKVGVIPQFKSLFSGKEFLTVADIDKLIAKAAVHGKSTAYEFDHSLWGKDEAQNSFNERQLVIQVKSLPRGIQSEIDSKDYLSEFMGKVLDMSRRSGHPRAYGWARVHFWNKDTWVIDEIQSDIIKIYNDLNRSPDLRADQLSSLVQKHWAEIGAFVKKHFKDIRDVIISAVRERAHKAGVDNIEHMNVEFKVKQNLEAKKSPYGDHELSDHVKVLNSEGKIVSKTKGEVELGKDTPIPAHYVDTYLKSLEKDGFERDEKTQRFKIHSSLDWFLGNHDE
jgi:hypothetical protein